MNEEKYGWVWKTEKAYKNYVNILMISFKVALGGMDHGQSLKHSVERANLADEIIALEGYPESFQILTMFCNVFATVACLTTQERPDYAKNYVTKAEIVWSKAEKFFTENRWKDPEYDDLANNDSLRDYFRGICQIYFAKYLLTNTQDIQLLQEVEPYCQKGISLSSKDPVLDLINKVIQEKLYSHNSSNQLPSVEKKNEGCFIATAVYECEYASEVIILRKFRDNVLLKTIAGKTLVKTYYFISPLIAQFISQRKSLKRIVKITILNRIVKYLNKTN